VRCISPLLFLTFLVVFLSNQITNNLKYSFPPLTELILDSGKDLSTLLFGMRRLGADMAWISVLQYYGAAEAEEKEGTEFGSGNYPSLKKLTLRTVRLDPSLHYATLYGAGALAFNLNRPEEAIEILQEGISRHPQYWKFQLYLGAILYKQKGKFDSMIHLLEDAIKYPDCPTLIKSILANIYKENGNTLRSLQIWIEVYEGKDESYREKSSQQIEELKKKLKINI